MAGRRRLALVVVAGIAALSLVACSSSNGDKETKKSDNGSEVTAAPEKEGTPVAVETGDKADGSQFLTVSPASVPAGPVTFTLKNTGTKEHEMIVLKTDTPPAELAVTNHRVSEDDSLGEVPETKEGSTGSVTLDLKPGKYVLACNVKKHYEKGMYAAFTVT